MTQAVSQHDLVVYIGRFSPLHTGHEALIRTAFEHGKNVLLLIGSVNKPRTIKDPWTYDERRTMVMAWRKEQVENQDKGFLVLPLHDEPYSDQLWIENVQREVTNALHVFGLDRKASVALIGSKRDWTTYYLDYFPTWDDILVPAIGQELSATKVREFYFQPKIARSLLEIKPDGNNLVSKTTYDFLASFTNTEHYDQLVREFNHIRKYKESWAKAPYAPTFVTVDNVVVQGGHVLLVERDKEPGAGLWALPGGFIEENEFLHQSAIRELKEETHIDVPELALKGSIKAREIFDQPGRSLRGRTITVAYLYKLIDRPSLPKVKAASDARRAEWISMQELDELEDKMFEDHYAIIKTMIRKLKDD